MILTHENKCAMCGKAVIIGDYHDNNKKEKEQQHQLSSTASTIIVEQIDGSSYTFDTADCVLMFKKFKDVYGSNFAENELLS